MAPNRPPLTPDLLRRYAAGALTPAEQYAVERRLLDDPLAAEAVEGLVRMRGDGVEVETATAALRARLQYRVAKRKGRVVSPTWARYAAAATVLLAVAGLGWWALREKPTASKSAPTRSMASPLADKAASPLVASSARGAVAPPADTGRAEAPPTEIADRSDRTGRQREAAVPAARDTAAGTVRLRSAPNILAKAAAPGAAKQIDGILEHRFSAFDDYVRANRRVAGQGTVTLSFRPGPGGRPRQVRVETSDNPALNVEAVRLLQEGPEWSEKNTTRHQGRVVYTVYFE